MKKFAAIIVVALMLIVSVVPAFAVESPQASTKRHDIIVIPSPGADGDFDYDVVYDEDGNQHVIIKPNPAPGYVFDHWEIDGPYSTDGKDTDETLDLIITGDVKIKPIYKLKGSSTVPTGTVNADNSGKSPQTGSNDVIPYAIVLLSLAACGAATLKLVKSK